MAIAWGKAGLPGPPFRQSAMSWAANGGDVRPMLGFLLLAVAGCTTTLDGRISPCRPEMTAPTTAGKTAAELECDIRVEDRMNSTNGARKAQ